MTGTRRDIIAATLKTELGSQVRVGLQGLDAIDIDAVASAVDDALSRFDGPSGEPNEGTPPDELSSANDG